MIRFSIRDVLWLTVVVAVLCGWWLDRSKLMWTYGKARETIASLREKLDRVDPHGDAEPRPMPMWPGDRMMRPEFGYALGWGVFALAGLPIVLARQGRIHWTFFEDRRRL